MRITDVTPGMICWFYSQKVSVLEVNRRNVDDGIFHSHVVMEMPDGSERTTIAACLISQEEIDEREKAKQARQREVEQVQQRLREFLPSVEAKSWWVDHMELRINQEDALRILDVKSAARPKEERLPCNISDPAECRKASTLLAQRVRRAIGEGRSSKWMGGDFDPASPTMVLASSDDAIAELLKTLRGKEHQPASALARLFS